MHDLKMTDHPNQAREVKMLDLEMADQVACHENDGPSKSRGVKCKT